MDRLRTEGSVAAPGNVSYDIKIDRRAHNCTCGVRFFLFYRLFSLVTFVLSCKLNLLFGMHAICLLSSSR